MDGKLYRFRFQKELLLRLDKLGVFYCEKVRILASVRPFSSNVSTLEREKLYWDRFRGNPGHLQNDRAQRGPQARQVRRY